MGYYIFQEYFEWNDLIEMDFNRYRDGVALLIGAGIEKLSDRSGEDDKHDP